MIVEKYTPELDRRTVVLRVEGLIKLGESAEFFRAALAQQLNDDVSVVVDCSKIDYIDSTGLAELISATSAMAGAGRKLVLSGVSGRILALLRLAELTDTLATFETEHEALASIAEAEAHLLGVPRVDRRPLPAASRAPAAITPTIHEPARPQLRPAERKTPPIPSPRSLRVFVCHA